MKETKRNILWPILTAMAVTAIAVWSTVTHHDKPFQKNQGFVFGTVYEITYQSDKDLEKEILARLEEVNQSLSPFEKNSIISHVNRNEEVTLDSMFVRVWRMAMETSRLTEGAFDITVAPLVNAWGFGFKHGTGVDDRTIDSLRQFIGYTKVSLEGGKVKKQDPRTMLDCSAIAKGYGCDEVGRLLREHGVENFMVNIGGEIVCQGKSPKLKAWQIGVNKPTDDSTSTNNEIETIIPMEKACMATSGNYRNFYYKDGKKYAHTIDPRLGRPVSHSLLSATVIAESCAQADAYATSFMVMGLEKAKKFLARHKELKAYLIYADSKGNYKNYTTPNLLQK